MPSVEMETELLGAVAGSGTTAVDAAAATYGVPLAPAEAQGTWAVAQHTVDAAVNEHLGLRRYSPLLVGWPVSCGRELARYFGAAQTAVLWAGVAGLVVDLEVDGCKPEVVAACFDPLVGYFGQDGGHGAQATVRSAVAGAVVAVAAAMFDFEGLSSMALIGEYFVSFAVVQAGRLQSGQR
jgi:hypothetical protein